jgi:nicotinamide riboside kinase
LKTIVVTGPESTGKTMISEYLAGQLHCPWIPEYARNYIGSLHRHYNYSDLVHIAENQVAAKNEMEKAGVSMLVLDTWLIITKVWFMEVYNKYPEWIDKEIKMHNIDLFLVCKPDIPWIPDPLRENGGGKREYLMNRYIEDIQKTGMKYILTGGTGDERFKNALESVKMQFNLPL